MAEAILDLRDVEKHRAYPALHGHIVAVLAGIDDDVAAMATMSSLIHHAFGHLWTGFYRVVTPEILRVGPYQGALGCLEIAIGRGVCGTAAAQRRTIVVPDVSRFPGHIACDARSQSEIVVPVMDATGALTAVLDIDSDRLGAFDDEDARGLARIVGWFAKEPRG